MYLTCSTTECKDGGDKPEVKELLNKDFKRDNDVIPMAYLLIFEHAWLRLDTEDIARHWPNY